MKNLMILIIFKVTVMKLLLACYELVAKRFFDKSKIGISYQQMPGRTLIKVLQQNSSRLVINL